MSLEKLMESGGTLYGWHSKTVPNFLPYVGCVDETQAVQSCH